MRTQSAAALNSLPVPPMLLHSPSPPELLELAGRILELFVLNHSQGAEHFHVVENPLTFPIPLLDLVPIKDRRKMLRK